MTFRYTNLSIWSKVGHFNKSLSKGSKSTRWIWNLHADAHDFSRFDVSLGRPYVGRQIVSSNLAHLGTIFFWLSGMLFHGAYLSNYVVWIKSPSLCVPSAHPVWSFVGQHILNAEVGNYFQGIRITSGVFQLWVSQGLVSQTHLKYACGASLCGSVASFATSYLQLQFYGMRHVILKKFKTILVHHLVIVFGLDSIAGSGHLIHISYPLNHVNHLPLHFLLLIAHCRYVDMELYSESPYCKGYCR